MDTKVNYTLVGFFVITLVLMLAGFLLWMNKYGFVEESIDNYLIKMDEAVSGLNIESPVKYRGVNVGVVDNILISKQDPEIVEVHISVKGGTPITQKSIAVLASQGITGLSYIEIKGGAKGAQRLKNGDTIPSGKSLLVKLEDYANQITEKLVQTLSNIDSMLSKENIEAINSAIRNIDTTTQTLNNRIERLLSEKNIQSVESTLANSSKLTNILANKSDRLIARTLDLEKQATNTLEDYSDLAKELNKTMIGIQQRVERGEFDIREMTEPHLDAFNALIKRLEGLSIRAEELLDQLKQSPSDILFKQTKAKAGPGE